MNYRSPCSDAAVKRVAGIKNSPVLIVGVRQGSAFVIAFNPPPAQPVFAMKSATVFGLVLVTAPNLKTARSLARTILNDRLAACVNLVPKIESHYWWQGKIESGTEVLLVIKTRKTKLKALEKTILAVHPYQTPEFLVLPLTAGSDQYLAWLAASCC